MKFFCKNIIYYNKYIMENYIGNSNQFDNNNVPLNQQSPNMFGMGTMGSMGDMGGMGGMNNNPQSSPLFNQPSNLPSTGFGNNFGSQSSNPIMSIDPTLLNGTSLDDTPNLSSGFNNPNPGSNFVPVQTTKSGEMSSKDPKLIKSVAREIINGLKENNMSLYDNSSINSYRGGGKTSNDDCDDDDNYSSNSSNKSNKGNKGRSKSKNKVKEVVETIEDFVIDGETNGTKSYSDYAGWFFDECFNYKDFLVLFILYFVLSQEMIKDFFAKYFSSLNPDYEGKIGVQGVIIYGLILTVLFMVVRKLF